MNLIIKRLFGWMARCLGLCLGASFVALQGTAFSQIPVLLPVCYQVTELDYRQIQNSTNNMSDINPIRLTDSGKFTGYIYYRDAPLSLLYYSPESGFVDLGRWNNGLTTRGLGINNRGQIAVGVGGPNLENMFRYSPGVGYEALGTLGYSEPGSEHQVRFINESGAIAGFSETLTREFHAFRWSSERGMEDLGTLGGWLSKGLGINAAGWVSGTSLDQNDEPHVFLSRPGQPMLDLGLGIAGDINNRGVIIGSGPNGIPELFYDGRRVKITLNFGIAQYSVGCLNDHNLFRGTYWDSRLGIGFTAIGGSERHGIVDLNKLIPTNSGWVLVEATGMNNKCQIVGKGWNGNAGRNTMFRLDPIIPPLTIRNTGTNVVLSWTEAFFPLQLEEAESAEATAWQAVSGVTTNSATLALAHTKRFYRLAIPPPPPPVQ